MLIEKKKLSELKPAPYNPRQSTKKQEEKLQASLKKFGVVEPVIYNKTTGHIVGGHFRVRELKKLGYKEVECVIVELSEADEKELNIRLNANTGGWDFDELANNWNAEDLNEWGLEIPGFDAIDIVYNEVGDSAPTSKVRGESTPVRIGRLLMFIDESKDKKRADKIWEVFFKKYEKMSDSEKATLEEKITVALNEISSDY